ncbi:hypothetical protein BJX61DRAFT_239932 [Aspergillus egyptiacus]|nr:hypothetical protein BJX61DRAFT_239932 [Aspergillus egyptiacus]
MLIRFFQDKQGLAPFQVERNSLAYYLRSTWISHALADPCLLHATLFSASVQLDAFTGARQSSYTTLYHQFHAVSLVRSRLAMALNSPDDATIGAVLLLAIHGSLQMNRESAEVHRQGLLQIVALRGGLDKLGFDGFLAQVIQGSLSFLAITFDQPEPFPTSDHPQEAPLGPHTLIRFILDGLAESPNEDLRRPLLALFGDLEHVVREACTVTVTPNETLPNSIYYSLLDSLHSTEPSPPQQPSPPSLSKKEFALLQACSISARIIASLLDYRTPWSERHLARLVSDLDRAITTTERATWLKHCPEASIWVAVLGAAMHDDVDGRASFILKENCVASARRVSGWARYVAGRCCYRWLRDRRVGRRAGLVPI